MPPFVPPACTIGGAMQRGSLGARIHAARSYAGISREQLAELLDVAAITVGRYERNEITPKRPAVHAIARACGVPDWFVETGFENDESPPPKR
mgnify:CR=1 FL=1